MRSLLPDQRRSSQDRYTLFLMILMGVFLIQIWNTSKNQQQRQDLAQQQAQPLRQQKPERPDPAAESRAETAAAEDDSQAAVAATTAEPAWVTLGSMDPKSPYRMLVTLTNRGAAVARIELNTPKYRDVQDPSGYLGQIVVDTEDAESPGEKDGGVIVQVVGPGTPAYRFGLKVGDRIVRFERTNKKTGTTEISRIVHFDDLRNNLLKTRPGEHIDLAVIRAGLKEPLPMTVILGQHPMGVVRPESVPRHYEDYRRLGGLRGVNRQEKADTPRSDPLSFLTTLYQVDEHQLDFPASLNANNAKIKGIIPRDKTLDIELTGVQLREDPWELVSSNASEAVFRRTIPAFKLEMLKTFRLAEINMPEDGRPKIGDGYDLALKIEIRNLDSKERKVAYQLDGPTGLPLEGGWYSRKTGPGWGAYGIRDIVVRFHGNSTQTISNKQIADDRIDKPWIDDPLDYIGVDSQYFQCTLKPNKPLAEDSWHVHSMPIRVGEKNVDWSVLTDVSYRLLSRTKALKPGDGPDSRLEHEYSIFVGPKDTRILAAYDLGETISYGWFWFVAQPLLGVLHFFHSLGMTYAMAIIALTVCVRLLMFPMSRKQALGAIKMAAIQPALKEIAEKYKDDMQARSRAQSEVFKKHNYHPMSGCLPLFIQLPIFIGLYKALSIDAGLHGTPLISPAVRWCNDLSAPDMLVDWSAFWNWVGWPGFNTGQGMFALGPYFNLLPILTIVLFLMQQAVMMPPPTDEQSRMQRKMMQYMMIFMGFLFFKIPSGLCVYFVVSTLWGLAERRFIPKAPVPAAGRETFDVDARDPDAKTDRDRNSRNKKKSAREPEPAKKGFFGKLMREVADKAAEQRKLEKANKKDGKKRGKKR